MYGVSANYFDNQGIVKSTNLKRTILRGNIESKFFDDRLRLAFSVTNSSAKHHDVDQGALFSNMLTYMPTVNVRRPDGTFTEDIQPGWLFKSGWYHCQQPVRLQRREYLTEWFGRSKDPERPYLHPEPFQTKTRLDSSFYNNAFSGQASRRQWPGTPW